MCKFWIVLGIFFWLDSAFAFFQGIKKFSLHQNEYSSFLSNATKYVGGDAYNFIIYANQATACMVISGAFIIAGLLCFILYNMTKPKAEIKKEDNSTANRESFNNSKS